MEKLERDVQQIEITLGFVSRFALDKVQATFMLAFDKNI